MSWLASSDRLAHHLAHLVHDGGAVPPEHLDSALMARSAVLDLTTRVLSDVAEVTLPGPLPTLASAEADPVRALSGLLARHLRPEPVTGPGNAAAEEGTAAGVWCQVAREAEMAEEAWRTAVAGTRPEGAGAWTVVARTAAVAEAVGFLDRDLAGSAATAERPKQARQLLEAGWSGLASTASAAQQLAARGPLPEVVDVRPSTSRRVLPVRSVANLPAATERLGHLITRAGHLGPTDVRLLATAHARTTMRAARDLDAALPRSAPPEQRAVARALAEHAETFRAVVQHPVRAATLLPSDPRPRLQAGELIRHLTRPQHSVPSADPARDIAALVGYARAAAAVTTALEATARRSATTGPWVVPAGEDSRTSLHWVMPNALTESPRMLGALAAAAQDARHLRFAAVRAMPASNTSAPGTQRLTATLAAQRSNSTRMATPDVRPGVHRTGALNTSGGVREREAPER